MWIANLSYWGFNQYIIQRALAAKDLPEAQKGIVLAAFLKMLMPFVIVVPGIAAVVLAPDLAKPDQAYPTMLRLLPPGLLGLVFAALVAAIVASTASKINSIATIFTLDLYAKRQGAVTAAEDGAAKDPATERRLVLVGRIAAAVAIVLAMVTARPLLGKSDQAFQYIQEYTGFFTPGITVIFLMGLFWRRATEAGALSAAVASFVLSLVLKSALPELPFMNRMVVVFVAAALLAAIVSLLRPQPREANRVVTADVRYATTTGFNVAALGVVAILVALYATWW
jgi:SSS family solute:Na+ symporter